MSTSPPKADEPLTQEDVNDVKKLNKDCVNIIALSIAKDWQHTTRPGLYFRMRGGVADEITDDWLARVTTNIRTAFAGVASQHVLWEKVSGRWGLISDVLSLDLARPIKNLIKNRIENGIKNRIMNRIRNRIKNQEDGRGYYHIATLCVECTWSLLSAPDSNILQDSYKQVIALPETGIRFNRTARIFGLRTIGCSMTILTRSHPEPTTGSQCQ